MIQERLGVVMDGCMITQSGVIFDLFDPAPEHIYLQDIAHGLAYNCRWNGHTKRYWSVAQHCCMMFDRAPLGKELMYLFHDAEEAYWGDMIKPLKNIIKNHFPEIITNMKQLRKMIYVEFQIPCPDKSCEFEDYNLLLWENENVVASFKAKAWTPEKAKRQFLKRFASVRKNYRLPLRDRILNYFNL
jgi:hypothetical protein